MATNKKTLSTTSAVIECILFLENRTLSIGEIARLSHISEDRVEESLKEIKEVLDEQSHGIVLEKSEEGYQFVPRTTLYERLKRTYGKKIDTRLSRAAIETLTIIAYNQPVKRREIDNIRGTNSEDIVKRLRELEYIKIIDKTDEPGHPARYGTTRKFLYDFNLNSISELPRLDEEDSERFEEYDEEGNVLTGAEIKRRMKMGADYIPPSNDSGITNSESDELVFIDETEVSNSDENTEDTKAGDKNNLSEPILVKHQKNYSGNSNEDNEKIDDESDDVTEFENEENNNDKISNYDEDNDRENTLEPDELNTIDIEDNVSTDSDNNAEVIDDKNEHKETKIQKHETSLFDDFGGDDE